MAAKMDFDAKLVDLVCANPLLYKKEVRSSPYNLMKKKIELWRSIAASLGVDTKYCVTRWKNLKDKYRREVQKTKELTHESGGIKNATADTWHLLDKMSFLENHLRAHSTSTKQSNSAKSSAENVPTSWCVMDSEQLIEQIIDEDDPLQEAMEEQQNVVVETEKPETVVASTTATSSFMKRIETLLEGIDAANRAKAEKRIVAFLCRCQLKSLENQSIDDVAI
ncbi:transcription factor Adf-1 isoform X2 [Ceratitis capitata]|uniref:transcription factor Adf-1 isoform X2 n=1 Tax=Ceratitis capitata TaxID=7213 RepID=UPI0006188076|nr:transcription factor Adf-1 isoform X2 [Ceratitis capitata]